ncbi:LuxR family transcriptional regulator [Thermoactinospora rubra]|uniref:LuxR family transcriptional regulator n=1 Tax=Thermoactinospora rubra TaxID=1088767 RepID=UPI000A1044DA|nr:LuxR family transcriptional regulator [Thermoactinospora rubra]
MTVSVGELIAEGRAALRSGDAARARRALERAAADAPCAEVAEGLARACYLELDFPGAIEGWERAYALYRATGDDAGAIRVARMLSCVYLSVMGDRAVCNGWLARARTLLGQGEASSERGWVALNAGMVESDRARKDDRFREALAVARRCGDTDLEIVTLGYLGASLVHGDRVEEGMALLDEALAAVAGDEVDDFFFLEEIFCQLFSACERARDVTRAEQWSRIGEEIARRRNLPSVTAYCRTHYGGVLIEAGRWSEADVALTEAVRLWGLGRRSMLRAGALARLADLRVRQGRFEEAEQLLQDADPEADIEVARSLAAVRLAQGRPVLAVDLAERALHQVDRHGTEAAPLLALLVEAHLTAGEVEQAESAAEELAACARRHPSHYLTAVAALARGRVCLATGAGDPQTCLREALAAFARARMPVEVARSRLELARALAARRPEVALAEGRAALDAFDRLRAVRDADAAAALLRSLGVRTAAPRKGGEALTRREAEVLELLGHGLSNPEISERLFISRKTVEHHVGNILAKLGLRSRAEAAAYAARAEPGAQ